MTLKFAAFVLNRTACFQLNWQLKWMSSQTPPPWLIASINAGLAIANTLNTVPHYLQHTVQLFSKLFTITMQPDLQFLKAVYLGKSKIHNCTELI